MKKGLIKVVIAMVLIAGLTYGAESVLNLPKVEMAGKNPGG